MPTKTKRRRRKTNQTPLRDELQVIYDRAAEWRENRKEAGVKLRELRLQISDLADSRLALINQDRALVDHDLMPVDPTNPVAAIDEQLKALPDLGEADRIYEHAKALEEQYEREARQFAERHYHELVAELEPEAISVAEEVAQTRTDLLAALTRYKQLRDLSFDWAHQVQGLDPYRVIPGGHLIDLLNELGQVTIVAPVDPLEQAEAYVVHDPTDPDLDHRE